MALLQRPRMRRTSSTSAGASTGGISIYDHGDADVVAGAPANAIRSSVAQIDKASAKELKDGLEQASAGLAQAQS